MNQLPERIVCAANKHDGHIVLGLRHNDDFMQSGVTKISVIMDPVKQIPFKKGIYSLEAQGFLTNRGRWVDRKEAYEIATQQEQVLRKTGGVDSRILYSEDVY